MTNQGNGWKWLFQGFSQVGSQYRICCCQILLKAGRQRSGFMETFHQFSHHMLCIGSRPSVSCHQ